MRLQTTHSTRRFFLHYVEMVAAMFIGMFALMKPADWLFSALGASTSSQHPTMMLFSMGLTMTVPTIAWMRSRGYAWRPSNEMAASMVIPTAAAMALAVTGLMHGALLMIIEHVAMLAGMLIAMLLRREEYSGGHAPAHPSRRLRPNRDSAANPHQGGRGNPGPLHVTRTDVRQIVLAN